jgi:predicted alpha-1,2-mannosidase
MTGLRCRAVVGLLAGMTGLLSVPATAAAAVPGGDGRDLTALVNPLAGTLGSGFPMVGASLPFGLIQQGPDTGLPGSEDPVNYDGYSYADPVIRNFSLTHFDGAGIHIGGNLPFMPVAGVPASADPNSYGSYYDHATEVSVPDYYAATLRGSGIRAELTSTLRGGLQRYTFPVPAQPGVTVGRSPQVTAPPAVGAVIINPGRSIGRTRLASLTVLDRHTVQGWMMSEPSGGFQLFFTAAFDRPITGCGAGAGGAMQPAPPSNPLACSATGEASAGYVTFDTSAEPSVTMRVGISYVDQAGSAANLAAEVPPARTFDDVRRAGHDAWNARLHDIEVYGGEADQPQTFYTNLYRALLNPETFDDADGRYMGFDGAVHSVAAGRHHYTNLSLWDTYRTQNPLLELIEPEVAHDVYISMLDDYDQNHQVIPRWTEANLDYGIMGGDSATPFLADGLMRGLLRPAEARRAYAALIHQAITLPPVWPRENLDVDLRLGYIPFDVSDRGAAVTQEYAIDDSAVLRAARTYGSAQDVAMLTPRVSQWKHLLYPGSGPTDPNANFIRPRMSDGSWANPTSLGSIPGLLGLPGPPGSVPWSPNFQDGYQEGTGWQYLWHEPQDVAGLARAIGGTSVAVSRLDSFFSAALADVPYTVPVAQQYSSVFGIYYIGNQFSPANEPDLWTPWYYDWLGQPWKTAKVARAAMEVYNSRPDGMPGNDDTGTMSAWYVLASLGIYNVTPGVPAWELNSPAYHRVVLHLGAPDRVFTIDAPGASTLNKYIESATLRGGGFDRTYLTQCELRPGAVLHLALGPTEGSTWGTAAAAAPPSFSDSATPAPVGSCEQSLLGTP